MEYHRPVLLSEVCAMAEPVLSDGATVIDATLGFAGHTSALIELAAGKQVRFIGVDRDADALKAAQEAVGGRVETCRSAFADLGDVKEALQLENIQLVLMDIGVSSFQLDTPERGFSFHNDGPLDMRMDSRGELTAAEIVNHWPADDLLQIFQEYGEEKFAERIVRAIMLRRKKEKAPFVTTLDLAELVRETYPASMRYGRSHPATKTFQALRIAVNDEFGQLERGMRAAWEMLAPGGRLLIITFHSLEDRMVKYYFKDLVDAGEGELASKKPLAATWQEQKENRRSRSAKLRGIVKRA